MINTCANCGQSDNECDGFNCTWPAFMAAVGMELNPNYSGDEMKTQEEVDNDTEAYVRCRGDSVPGQKPCGLVPLTSVEYMAQMMRPDSLWCCPHCGSTAHYDDTESERVQGVNDEVTA